MSEPDPYLSIYFTELLFKSTSVKLYVYHNISDESKLENNSLEAFSKLKNSLSVREGEWQDIDHEELQERITTTESKVIVFSTDWPKSTPKPGIEKYTIGHHVFWADHFNVINSDAQLKKVFWESFKKWIAN